MLKNEKVLLFSIYFKSRKLFCCYFCYRGLTMNAFFWMQVLCIFFLCQQLACVFPLTHIFPLRSAIKCRSPWQPFWNIVMFNSIHRYLHCRDLKEKGFPVIFHGEIVLSTWHGLGHSSGCFIPPFPWSVIIMVGDKPWAVLLLEKLALSQ